MRPNTKTLAILASQDFLPMLNACIKSAKVHFGPEVDINVAWFGDTLPMVPKGVYVHNAANSPWYEALDTVKDSILASRPGFIKYLLEDNKYYQVLHIGADVMFYSAADWVFEAYQTEDTAACPHSCAPYPEDGKNPTDLQVHLTGQLNSDFVLYNHYKPTLDFLTFQIKKHQHTFGNDLSKGHFYDQVWLSFLPYYTKCAIIKDPRINVAYYNLHERKVIKTDTTYWIQTNDMDHVLYQLVCFQFTGYNPVLPTELSKYNGRPEIVNKDVISLCLDYHQKLEEAGWQNKV